MGLEMSHVLHCGMVDADTVQFSRMSADALDASAVDMAPEGYPGAEVRHQS